MAEVQNEYDAREHRRGQLWKLIAPLAGVMGSLALMAVIYLSYDLVKGKVSPCESIFQQASVGLSTRIKFLKAEGELKIGREAITELDERAQMTALDLKTCCTVLDAGRINPEQFLQCKTKARSYDARIEDIAALLRLIAPASSGTALVSGAAGSISAPVPELETAVEAARSASRDLNQRVVEIVKDQALQSLETAQVSQLAIDAAEREPNDDGLNANLIDMGKGVKAAIGTAKDVDVYTFTTPATYRDWVRIELQNQSTTLDPDLEMLDAEKASLGSVHNGTPGGDVSYEFVASPLAKFSVRVGSYYGQSTGVYLIRIVAGKAYDAYEPNDDILSARRITEGATIKAKVMDKDDVDIFAIAGASDGERAMTVSIMNASTTLHPNVVVYDASKSEMGNAHNATAGGDLSYAFKAGKGPMYVRVTDYYAQSGGEYSLSIAPQ